MDTNSTVDLKYLVVFLISLAIDIFLWSLNLCEYCAEISDLFSS